jgi:hypothetical protein
VPRPDGVSQASRRRCRGPAPPAPCCPGEVL